LDRYRKNPVHYSHPVNDVLTDHGNVSNKLRDDVYEYRFVFFIHGTSSFFLSLPRPLQGVSESRSSGKSYGQFGENDLCGGEWNFADQDRVSGFLDFLSEN
jgi:hypothetical protein